MLRSLFSVCAGTFATKRFRSAATTISCTELTHRMRKGQFDLCALGLKDTAASFLWNAVLFNQ